MTQLGKSFPDNVCMNLHLSRAGQLFKTALLPDRTVSRFIDAALDGSGQKSKAKEAFRGMGEDLFEVVNHSGKAIAELGRAIRG